MESLRATAAQVKHVTGLDIPVLLAVIATVTTVCILWTRFTTGIPISSASGKPQPPPSLPYWTPLLGHLPQWIFGFDGLLGETKTAFHTGISTLFLGTERHQIVSSPELAGRVQTENSNQVSNVLAKKRIWRNVFSVPKNQLDLYNELASAIQIPTQFHLNADLETVKSSENQLLRRLQGNIPDLVTFNPNLIDQELWERVSAIKVSEDQKLAEVSLPPLVFLFLTHMTTDTFISNSLLSDQDHHEVGPLLLAFIQSYPLLMTGLPRWVPHPTLPGAHITRRKLLKHLEALLDITEDAELQNDLLSARARMLDDHKAPRGIRTIELLRLLHGLNLPHVLTFWMLLHIISDANLLEKVRTEAIKVVSIVQEAPVMGFSVPPRISVDAGGLLGPKTPLLKRCWLETARLYSRGLRTSIATEDFDLKGQEGSVFKTPDLWEIKKGDWIDAPYWHSNRDAAMWEDPMKWDPERHINEKSEDLLFDTKVFDTFGVFGMDEAIKPARLFALAFIASTVLLYDFEIEGEKGIPKPQFAAGVALPEGDVRVRIRKRVCA